MGITFQHECQRENYVQTKAVCKKRYWGAQVSPLLKHVLQGRPGEQEGAVSKPERKLFPEAEFSGTLVMDLHAPEL